MAPARIVFSMRAKLPSPTSAGTRPTAPSSERRGLSSAGALERFAPHSMRVACRVPRRSIRWAARLSRAGYPNASDGGSGRQGKRDELRDQAVDDFRELRFHVVVRQAALLVEARLCIAEGYLSLEYTGASGG